MSLNSQVFKRLRYHPSLRWLERWEEHPKILGVLSVMGLAAVFWLAFLGNLGSIGLVDETEPLFAEAARQMTITGDWITPFFNGETRFDKPPLVYWLMALGYQFLGVNEWAVRLPSALAAIALTILGFYTLRHFGFPNPTPTVSDPVSGSSAESSAESISEPISEAEGLAALPAQTQRQLWLSAWIGGALIALNAETIVWARTGVSDMLLSGCIGSALFCFFWAYTRSPSSAAQLRWALAFYSCLGLAILTKGPVGIAIPGLAILPFLFYVGQLRQVWCEMRPLRLGLPIVLAIALPWYLLVIWANGMDYINSFFGYHNLERFTSVVNRHSAPWYFYFLVVLAGFAPLSVYLPVAIARLRFWQRSRWRQQPRSHHLGLFALFWFVSIFLFFTVAATKLPSYVLPLMPAAAILVGLLWSHLMTRSTTRSASKTTSLGQRLLQASIALNLLFLLALAIAAAISPDLIGYDPVAPRFPEALRASQLHLVIATIWGGSAIATALLWLWGRFRWLWTANLLGFIGFIAVALFPFYTLMDQQRQQPMRELAAIAVEAQEPCIKPATYQKGAASLPENPKENSKAIPLCSEMLNIGFNKPTLVFYSQRPVTHFPARPLARVYLEKDATDPAKSPMLLIFIQSHKLHKLVREIDLQPNEYRIIARRGAYTLIEAARAAFAKA